MGQASPYEVIPSQNEINVFINTQKSLHGGSPMNLYFTYTYCFYPKFYYGRPAASADGTVDEDKGCSLSNRTTFDSVGGGMTHVSNLVSTLSTGWMMSS